MKLTNMKLDTKKDAKDAQPTMLGERSPYPWGLALTLDDESITKVLGTDLPEVGETLLLAARVKVTSVSSNDSGGGTQNSVSLQITEMTLEDADEMTFADKLYAAKK